MMNHSEYTEKGAIAELIEMAKQDYLSDDKIIHRFIDRMDELQIHIKSGDIYTYWRKMRGFEKEMTISCYKTTTMWV